MAWYLLLFGIAAIVHLSMRQYAADDAYIHFRISRNFAQEGRPYYDVNTPLMTTSSPIHTIQTTLLLLITDDPAFAMAITNALWLTLAAWCASVAIGFVPGIFGWKADAAGALIVSSTCGEASVSLMESPCALACFLGGFVLYQRRNALAFAVLASCVFIRLELAVYLLAFLSHAMFTGRIHRWRVVGMCLAGALPWLAFQWYYFADLIPHTVRVKSTIYNLNLLDFFLITCRYLYGPHFTFQGRALLIAHLIYMPVFAAIVYVSRQYLADSNRADALQGNQGARHVATPLKTTNVTISSQVHEAWSMAAVLLVMPSIALFAAYAFRHVLMFPWYIPLFTTPITLGTGIMCFVTRRPWITLAWLVFMLPVSVNLMANVGAAIGPKAWYTDFTNGARARRYLTIARELNAVYPGATLLSCEAGALGYAFDGPFVDAASLVTPWAIKYHPAHPSRVISPLVSNGAYAGIPPSLVSDTLPELIISYACFASTLEQATENPQYVVLKLDVFNSDDMPLQNTQDCWFGDALYLLVRNDIYRYDALIDLVQPVNSVVSVNTANYTK